MLEDTCRHVVLLLCVLVIGLFTPSDVRSMMTEILKMKDFDHPNVMTLIGVCLDAGPGISIIMPFVANGSLHSYLNKERDNLDLNDDKEIDMVSKNIQCSLI